MDAALHWYTGWRWAQILEKLVQAEWKWCHDVKVEAVKHPSMHPTSTLYLYKVFEHLKMLWLRSRVQPYMDTPMTIYSDFGKLGQAEWKWCNDVMVEAVKHPRVHPNFTLYIYKVFQHLKMLWISSRVQPYTDTPMTIYSDFEKIGSGWVKMMQWCHGWGGC